MNETPLFLHYLRQAKDFKDWPASFLTTFIAVVLVAHDISGCLVIVIPVTTIQINIEGISDGAEFIVSKTVITAQFLYNSCCSLLVCIDLNRGSQ